MSMGNQMNMKNNHKTARDITGDHVTPQNRDTPRAQYREDSRNYRKHSKKNLDLIGRSLAENGQDVRSCWTTPAKASPEAAR